MKRLGWLMAVLMLVVTADRFAGNASATERIAAIVNKEVILASDVDEETQKAAYRMRVNPADSVAMKSLRKDVLNQMVEREVLLAEAKRLGITVPASEVNQAVDREIEGLRLRLGSEERFQQALAQEHTTEADLRKRYEPDIRDQLIISRLVGKEVQTKATVTDTEVRAYFDSHRDSLGNKPEQLRLAHILIAFEPDSMQVRRARATADSLRQAIVKGESFETVAERFSDDPSSRAGGDLGTFTRGQMVPEFEEMAFSLKPMELSQPVRTRFGYHIIQVLEHFPPTDSLEERVHARHVMIQAKPTEADEDRARRKALAVRDSLMRGADFAAMARKYSADSATKDSGGVLGDIPVPNLPANLREPLSGLSIGEVSVPFKREAGYHIFKVLARIPESEYKFEEIQDEIRQIVQNEKLEENYKRWYDRVRKTVNVQLRD